MSPEDSAPKNADATAPQPLAADASPLTPVSLNGVVADNAVAVIVKIVDNATLSGWQDEYMSLLEQQKEIWNIRMGAQRRQHSQTEVVSAAKARVARQPKIIEMLEELQHLEHERSVGVYEKLLTAILSDALPGDRRAVLELGSSRGLPALEIEIEKEGQRESILAGSGGAVTNIICAGLRLIALARSQNRRFIVLDEPDCWLKPSRVPKFASTLGQVATQIGAQALLISHHDPHFFAGVANLLRLEKQNGKIVAEDAAGAIAAHWPDPAQPGIRWLRLINFMSHEDTLLRLSPGINCLTGENDIGKSACVTALRALFYGKCLDSYVKHGAASCAIEAELENGQRVMMRHFLKKSPKRVFELAVPGEDVVRSSPKGGVPEWMEEIGKITLLDGLDAQLGNQKEPIFLLQETPEKRASILAIGREAGHLQAMIALNRQKALADNAMVKNGEIELFEISRVLQAIGDIDAWPEASKALRALGFELEEERMRQESDRELLARARRGLARQEAQAAAIEMLKTPLPATPRLEAVDELRQKHRAAIVAWRVAQMPKLPEVPGAPELDPTDPGRALARAARRARLAASVAVPEEAPLVPFLDDTRAARELLANGRVATAIAAILIVATVPDAPSVEAIDIWRQISRKARIAQGSLLLRPLPASPEIPVLEAEAEFRGLVSRGRIAASVALIPIVANVPEAPEVETTDIWRRIAHKARVARDSLLLQPLPESPEIPVLEAGAEFHDLVARGRVATAVASITVAATVPEAPEVEMTDIWRQITRKARIARDSLLLRPLPDSPEPPVIEPSAEFRDLISRARKEHALSAVVIDGDTPQVPILEETTPWSDTLRRARQAFAALSLEPPPEVPFAPELEDTAVLRALIARGRQAQATIEGMGKKLEEIAARAADFEAKWGDSCPTCGQHVNWAADLLGVDGAQKHSHPDAHDHEPSQSHHHPHEHGNATNA